MISNYAVTIASVHHSQIDLSFSDIVNYKYNGPFGDWERRIGSTMDESLKGYKLPVEAFIIISGYNESVQGIGDHIR